ncbi:MAG: hypothetical protein ACFB2Y_14665, partial [Fulvivirga sp.]
MSDFERANDILDVHLKNQLFTQIPNDYYLGFAEKHYFLGRDLFRLYFDERKNQKVHGNMKNPSKKRASLREYIPQ